jgi:hypothetical protein
VQGQSEGPLLEIDLHDIFGLAVTRRTVN